MTFTNWTEYNQNQTNEQHQTEQLLHDLLHPTIKQKKAKTRGRPKLSTIEKIKHLHTHAHNQTSSRRTINKAKNTTLRKHTSTIPHFNTITNHLKNNDTTKTLTELIKQTSLPLKELECDFAIDSTGFSTTQYEKWLDVRTRLESKKRNWLKAHVICGVRTNIITHVIISSSRDNDSQFLIPLVGSVVKSFDLREVSADKAYCSKENIEYIDSVGAVPFIPFKEGFRGRGLGPWSRAFFMFKNDRGGFYEGYGKRNNVESAFSMLKRRFGFFLRSRCWVGQVNEVLLKVLCHNLCVLNKEIYFFLHNKKNNKCAKPK